MISQKCTDRPGADIGHLKFNRECEFDRRSVTLEEEVDTPFTVARVTVPAQGAADEAKLARAAEEIEKYRPLSRRFRAAGI